MDRSVLEFERPIVELEQKIETLKQVHGEEPTFDDEIGRLEAKCLALKQQTYASLSPWQIVQLSRHPSRPYTLDYIDALTTDFLELRGDRAFGDDAAIVGGVASFRGRSIVIIGHQKGRNTKENMLRNFGMPSPEGYRKAKRLMQLASRFGLPVVTLIDTPGAYPGIEAEERGQAQAIADNLEVMAGLPVPVVAVVIGEGGSGGALALAVANRVLMLRFSIFSVISPEGCASILWKDGTRAADAASVLRLTASDLEQFAVADQIVDEPSGGAHRSVDRVIQNVGNAVEAQLDELCALSAEALKDQRYDKYRQIGALLDNERDSVAAT